MPHSRRRQPRPWWKTCALGCGIGCGTGGVLLLAAALIAYNRMLAVPPSASQPPPSPAQPAGSPQPDAPAAQPPLDAQLEEIKQAARAGQTRGVSLRVDEAQINELLLRETNAGSPLQNPRVTLGAYDMTLTGTTNWQGRQVYLTVVARPVAAGGRIGLQVNSVQVGRLGLPGPMVASIQREIDNAMAKPIEGFDVTDVSILNRQLVISGNVRPQ